MNRLQAKVAGFFRPRLHVRFIDLHYVGAGGEQVQYFLIYRGGVVHGHRGFAGIEIVLRLLRHRERARHGDLNLRL